MYSFLDRIKDDLIHAIEADMNAHKTLLQYAGNDARFVSYYSGYMSALLKAQSIIDNYGDLYPVSDEGVSDDDINVAEVLDVTCDPVDINDLDFLFDIRGKHDLL